MSPFSKLWPVGVTPVSHGRKRGQNSGAGSKFLLWDPRDHLCKCRRPTLLLRGRFLESLAITSRDADFAESGKSYLTET